MFSAELTASGGDNGVGTDVARGDHIHDGRYYTEAELGADDGDAPNVGSNVVHWNNLNGVPAGIADGDQDTTYTAGDGLDLTGTVFSADLTGSGGDNGTETSVARGDHVHDGRYYTETELGTSGGGGAVHWSNLTSVPAGFADGTDDTGGTADDVACAGCIDTSDLAPDAVTGAQILDGTITVADLGFNPATQSEVDAITGLPGFATTTIDSDQTVGGQSSVTVGPDGLPIVAYWEATDGRLKVARCLDISCTTSSIEDVDGTPAAGDPSIAIGSDGLPIIAYYGTGPPRLKVAHCDDLGCSTSTRTAPDADGINGLNQSIAIGVDGLPVISYYFNDDKDLRFAHCTNVDCTASTTTTLDAAGFLGSANSITIGTDGFPLISYHDETNSALKAVHCTAVDCSTFDAPVTLDNTGVVGSRTSIATGADGRGIIAYFDSDSDTIDVAHCDDLACSTATSTTLAATPGDGPQHSLGIGVDGLPVISYGTIGDGLGLIHCSDLTYATWTSTTVDGAGSLASHSALTIGIDGRPLISYSDDTDGDLEVVHCSNPLCIPHFRRR